MLDQLKDILKIRYRQWRIAASLQRNDALGALHRAWGYVHATQLSGDYYEFGVYQGASLFNSWLSWRFFRNRLERSDSLPFERTGTVAEFLRHRPVFYAFDTYCGMPDNAEGEDTLATGSFQTSLDLVRRRCAIAGLTEPTARFIPGLFADTAEQIGAAPAAVVHIDCDLYASAVDALRVIRPRLVQGTVLLMDDYNLFRASNAYGERRALREFTESSGITVEPWFAYGPASQAFFCHL